MGLGLPKVCVHGRGLPGTTLNPDANQASIPTERRRVEKYPNSRKSPHRVLSKGSWRGQREADDEPRHNPGRERLPLRREFQRDRYPPATSVRGQLLSDGQEFQQR
jgi:hypothetical protein